MTDRERKLKELELLQLQEQELELQARAQEASKNVDAYNEYLDTREAMRPGNEILDAAEDVAKTVGSGALRAADYAGGLGRVTYQTVEDLAREAPLARDGDLKRALLADAPTTEEYLERAGVPEGYDRMAAGMLGDIAKDPFTYGTLGLSALPRLAKLPKAARAGKWGSLLDRLEGLVPKVRPDILDKVPRATETIGSKIYRSGLKELDIEGTKYGKEPVSEVLENADIAGWTMGSIRKQSQDLAKKYLTQRDDILRRSTEKGGKLSGESFGLLKEKIDELKKINHPDADEVANSLQDDLDNLVSRSEPTTTQASQWKTIEQRKVSKPEWAGQRQTMWSEGQKAKASDLRAGTEKAVELTDGSATRQELQDLNDAIGRILTSDDRALKEAAKEARRPILSQTKAAVTKADPLMGAVMKGVELMNMAGPRTMAGRGMMRAGRSGMPVTNTLLYSPWSVLRSSQLKGEEQ